MAAAASAATLGPASMERTQMSGAALSQRVPWTIWAGMCAVTSSVVGGAWDVAWHRSIGRDSFLTPAHLAIYACGVIAAVVCAYLIFGTTFGKSEEMHRESVGVLGFRAPLGAFIAAWGGIAMLVSAPFDNWWHNAYGLDVKILSPPHVLLMLGVRCVSVGVMFLLLAAMNRAAAANRLANEAGSGTFKLLQALFLYLGGLMIIGQMFGAMEATWDVYLHGPGAYVALAIAVPVAFAVISRASRSRWACTIAAAIYTAFALLQIWIFPLVPATPKLGPVFVQVTHLVPAKFPILLLVPAIVLDLLWIRLRAWKPWQIAAVSGVVFVAAIFMVEWPLATFLMSKASQNRFFGTIYFDFNSPPDGPDRLRQFWHPVYGAALYAGLLKAAVVGSLGTWVGLRFGGWMRGVQR